MFDFMYGRYLSSNYIWQCSALANNSGYKPADLKECVLIIHDLYLSRRGGSLQAVREKYKQHKVFCRIIRRKRKKKKTEDLNFHIAEHVKSDMIY
jgi:hypothetical protein